MIAAQSLFDLVPIDYLMGRQNKNHFSTIYANSISCCFKSFFDENTCFFQNNNHAISTCLLNTCGPQKFHIFINSIVVYLFVHILRYPIPFFLITSHIFHIDSILIKGTQFITCYSLLCTACDDCVSARGFIAASVKFKAKKKN